MAGTAAGPRADRRALPLFALAAGIVLAGAGGLRFVEAAGRLPVDTVLLELGRGHDVGPAELAAAQDLLAGPAGRSGADLKDRARLTLEAALRPDADPAGTATALAAVWQDLQDGLAEAPADPFAWLRLCHAEILLHGFTPLARGALERSLAQSANYGPLLAAQLDFGLLLWPVLTPETRLGLMRQVPQVAIWSTPRLVEIARRRAAEPRLSAALAQEPRRLAYFRKLYARVVGS